MVYLMYKYGKEVCGIIYGHKVVDSELKNLTTGNIGWAVKQRQIPGS